jgi:hypothetical protein
MFVGEIFRQRVDEILRPHGVFGVAAVHGPARERRMVAQVFHARAAVFAAAVRLVQPGDAHARTGLKP